MPSALGNAFNIATGRYWWVLCVHSSAEVVFSAQIFSVTRKRGANCNIVLSFSGTLEECRRFQILNGGSADGVLLVDDSTPVKIVSEEIGSTADFPGFKPENLDCVESLSGTFSVAALKNAVESLARDVESAGFKLLAHVPSILFYSELIRFEDSQPHLVCRIENEFTDLWVFLDGSLVACYKVAGDASKDLSRYARDRFLLGEIPVEECSVDDEALAKAVSEDAWVFRTDNLSAFHTAADKKALSRIHEAAFFRRSLKACIGIIFISLIVLFAFEAGTGVYMQRSEAQIQSFESKIHKQKELEQIWNKLENDRNRSESYLKHRSKISSSMGVFAATLPESVWLVHWNISKKIHTVQGYAASSEDVSTFLSILENERNLVNVRLRTTEKTTWRNRPVVKFDLTAEDVQ